MIVISGISLYRGSFNSVLFQNFTVTLAGKKNLNRYIGNIVTVISKISISRFHCIIL